jgi:muramoyltetrapeptide carboxypeptidase LdcA involved in peptidoglycan recycling
MIFPKYLESNGTIGITACSAGVLKKIEKYEKSINNVKKNGFKIIETNNVRTDGVVSSDKITRARELESLFINDNIDMVAIASGGDFLYDMLTEVDFSLLKENVKWLAGSSDPTSLLFTVTTNLDIATIYSPCNMSGFNISPLHESYVNYFEILKGNLVKQCKYDTYEGESFSDEMNTPNEWLNINGNVDESGVLIGGCIDSLKDIIGTKFDKAKEFIDKYKDEGIIWYFDVFSLTSEGLYNTLVQFRNAGWFEHCKAILIGKVCIPNTYVDMTYEELIEKAIPDIKVIYKFDIGHVKPSFTMINGAKVRVVSSEDEGYLEYLV